MLNMRPLLIQVTHHLIDGGAIKHVTQRFYRRSYKINRTITHQLDIQYVSFLGEVIIFQNCPFSRQL